MEYACILFYLQTLHRCKTTPKYDDKFLGNGVLDSTLFQHHGIESLNLTV